MSVTQASQILMNLPSTDDKGVAIRQLNLVIKRMNTVEISDLVQDHRLEDVPQRVEDSGPYKLLCTV